jgi:hypothetical protein
MTQMSETDSTAVGGERTGGETLSKGVDWVVTALLVLGGLLFGLLGVFMNGIADRAEIARLVADGTIQSTTLSDAELVDVTYSMAWWGGLGLVVTGVLMLVGGVAFFTYRRRARERRTELGMTGPDTTTNAIVGGVITIVAGFVPLSPILGGAIAGYLQRGSRDGGAKVGAFSGVVASVPIALLFAFLVVGLGAVVAEVTAGVVAIAGILGLVVGLVAVIAYMVGLGALGGYLGAYLREDRTPKA